VGQWYTEGGHELTNDKSSLRIAQERSLIHTDDSTEGSRRQCGAELEELVSGATPQLDGDIHSGAYATW
jgi:hypothetical protein